MLCIGKQSRPKNAENNTGKNSLSGRAELVKSFTAAALYYISLCGGKNTPPVTLPCRKKASKRGERERKRFFNLPPPFVVSLSRSPPFGKNTSIAHSPIARGRANFIFVVAPARRPRSICSPPRSVCFHRLTERERSIVGKRQTGTKCLFSYQFQIITYYVWCIST